MAPATLLNEVKLLEAHHAAALKIATRLRKQLEGTEAKGKESNTAAIAKALAKRRSNAIK